MDITAPGTNLYSAYYGGQTGGNAPHLPGSPAGPPGGPASYSLGRAGTSYAAPIVAGGAALLDDVSYATALPATSRDARVIKANLLNSADKTVGWTNGQADDGFGVIRTTQSLDWALGAGQVNLDTAFDQYTAGTQDVPGLGGGNVQTIGWDYATIAAGAELVVTASA